MIYLICFCISFALLIFVMTSEKQPKGLFVLLLAVVLVANGGYYAIAESIDLDEAILATKVSYVAGIFGPLLIFLVVCDICKVNIPGWLKALMHFVQALIYMSVLTAGSTGFFYKSFQFHQGEYGSYLTKTYGPLHTVYVIFMVLYMVASIAVGFYSLNKKNIVSRINVYTILLSTALVIGIYMVERLARLQTELLPMAIIAGVIVILIPLKKISDYSVDNVHGMIGEGLQKTGYIIFNQNLLYMGSSEYATELYPELSDWNLEEKIPGNGGRFNTFLRQALTGYVKEGSKETIFGTYSYKNGTYSYQIGCLYTGRGRHIGYVIRVYDVTNVVQKTNA